MVLIARRRCISSLTPTGGGGGGPNPWEGVTTFNDDYSPTILASFLQMTPVDVNVVRIRRTSDDAELDFNAEQVYDGTLESWVGVGNDGYVVIMYDQSGNGYHISQSAAGDQPRLVIDGVRRTENGNTSMGTIGVYANLHTTHADMIADQWAGDDISVVSVATLKDDVLTNNNRIKYTLWELNRAAANNPNLSFGANLNDGAIRLRGTVYNSNNNAWIVDQTRIGGMTFQHIGKNGIFYSQGVSVLTGSDTPVVPWNSSKGVQFLGSLVSGDSWDGGSCFLAVWKNVLHDATTMLNISDELATVYANG